MQDRIKKIASVVGNNTSESVIISALYNSDDDESAEFHNKPISSQQKSSADIKDVLKPSRGGLDNLNRQGGISDPLLSESKMSTITIMDHSTQQQHSVKIMDKSKRAYDCSIESTRALEMAISKN